MGIGTAGKDSGAGNPTGPTTVQTTATVTATPSAAPATATTTVTMTQTPTAAGQPQPSDGQQQATTTEAPDTTGPAVYYKNCAEARAAGVAPLHRGDPGYAPHLDRDGDGVACETS
ncbi:excalibur calcium-binding domain-containing protein [Kitasatospora terrestris]